MFCDFLISLFASFIAVLVSAAGYASGKIGCVLCVVEIIIVSILFFSYEEKSFTRRIAVALISYLPLTFISAKLGLYEYAFRICNPQYYIEYGAGYADGFGLMLIWLPFAGVMLALSALISRMFCNIVRRKIEYED